MDDARERDLAEALANVLDGAADSGVLARTQFPELAGELDALAEIDRAIDGPPPLPATLSGLKVLAEIGAGGMGRVLLAQDEALGRRVAIKTLAPDYAQDAGLRTRFMNEARALARINHPHIVRIYRLGDAPEPPHFVMEYVEGAPLNVAVRSLNWQQKAEVMRNVALAVHYLHTQGIIHRDLKPANILLSPGLEPKLLDFGLALHTGGDQRLSRLGEIAGTPEYLSPEQAQVARDLGARSDVFSLGSVLYEVLTGEPPFAAPNLPALLEQIRTHDPELPGRRAPGLPRPLQNICLKALEKDPAARYNSAAEMAADLQRFLAGEAVHADPAAYTRLIAGKVEQHLREIEAWRAGQVVSEEEAAALSKRYQRLLEREDSWILEARRLTLPQVALYLGAWVLAVAAAFLTFFPYPALAGVPIVGMAWAAVVPMAWTGVRSWHRQRYRVAIAYLMTFCVLAPIAVLVTLEETRLFATLSGDWLRRELFHRLEFDRLATNAQLWWAILAGLPVCWWLRRFTRAPVFSLMFALMAALGCLALLLRMGMLVWLDDDPGRFYFHLLPCALLFLAAGFAFERRRMTDDSRYFYPFAVAFTWAALSGAAAFHQPYAAWLKAAAPWTRGQVEYLFIGNAAVYFLLDRVFDRAGSPQLRAVARAFRFVIPGHVMTSLLLLGIAAKSHLESRVFEWSLPAVAAIFVFASIPRQMKNFFVSGLVFFAAGVYRLQQNVFPRRAVWPAALLVTGMALMLAAANYAPLLVRCRALGRRLRRA